MRYTDLDKMSKAEYDAYVREHVGTGTGKDWRNGHRTDGDGWGLDAGDDGWGEESVTPLIDRESRRAAAMRRASEYSVGERVVVTSGYFAGCPAVVKGVGEGTVSVTIAHHDWDGAPSYHLNERKVQGL